MFQRVGKGSVGLSKGMLVMFVVVSRKKKSRVKNDKTRFLRCTITCMSRLPNNEAFRGRVVPILGARALDIYYCAQFGKIGCSTCFTLITAGTGA